VSELIYAMYDYVDDFMCNLVLITVNIDVIQINKKIQEWDLGSRILIFIPCHLDMKKCLDLIMQLSLAFLQTLCQSQKNKCQVNIRCWLWTVKNIINNLLRKIWTKQGHPIEKLDF